ncbi:MAG TPA: hypothetical protein VGB54_04365 [Allosphingosinicella sp.]|jgi:hypothetical protein
MRLLGRRARETFCLENTTSDLLTVMIEVVPDRYVLQRGDKMEIDADTQGVPFHLAIFEGGVQIYAGNDSKPKVRINGKFAEPDWSTDDP